VAEKSLPRIRRNKQPKEEMLMRQKKILIALLFGCMAAVNSWAAIDRIEMRVEGMT
jgi:hypothetical protein